MILQTKKSNCIVILLVLFFTTIIFAQEATIKFIDTAIKVDGKLEETVWDNLPEISSFYNYLPTDQGIAIQQTVVKVFHDKNYLYVSAIYKDTEAKVQVSSLKRDASIGISDSFVFVLDSQNQQQNAYYFAVNGFGAQVDGLVGRTNDSFELNYSWNTIWKSAASVDGNQKIYELAIPLKSISYNKDSSVFGIQFYTRDIKKNAWTILTNVKRNFRLFDLRFTRPFSVEALPHKTTSRFSVTPSVTANYQNDVITDVDDLKFKPSLDVQYNITSSLKLDATINPDFSQIDVDQQVTNLTRFAVNFPEQRNFFLENSDLFSNLGVAGVNPFYSRRIGAKSDIKFGLKISGNISARTRIGLLDVQTGAKDELASQNYAVAVVEQKLSKNFTATGFLINRQETDKVNFVDDYNRVSGINVNYKSDNNKWLGTANFGKSFNDAISGDGNFYNAGIWYNKRGLEWNVALKKVEKNYITDVGFTPRLYNYDAINDLVIREGYTQTTAGVEYQKFYENNMKINSIRFLNYKNNTYFNEDGNLSQSSHFLNSAIFFKNLSAVYYVFKYDVVKLKYGFDPLRNGNSILPNDYRFGTVKVGYNSANNRKVRYRLNLEKGNYYSGKKTAAGVYVNYQLLPFANIELSHNINQIDLDVLGEETFNLTRFTGQIFFNNKLNWTTYGQYNTQFDNFNINSRLQWEYKPLSYVYLVVTDNYSKDITRKDWGISFKMNYRFDF